MNTWRLKNILPNINGLTIDERIKYPEENENKNTMTQNLWNTAKAVLKKKLRAAQVYLKEASKKDLKLTI